MLAAFRRPTAKRGAWQRRQSRLGWVLRGADPHAL